MKETSIPCPVISQTITKDPVRKLVNKTVYRQSWRFLDSSQNKSNYDDTTLPNFQPNSMTNETMGFNDSKAE